MTRTCSRRPRHSPETRRLIRAIREWCRVHAPNEARIELVTTCPLGCSETLVELVGEDLWAARVIDRN